MIIISNFCLTFDPANKDLNNNREDFRIKVYASHAYASYAAEYKRCIYMYNEYHFIFKYYILYLCTMYFLIRVYALE